jgi:23S rRNA pseudouridine2605 synthase
MLLLASATWLCYQHPMTDSNDKEGRGRGRPGDRNFGKPPRAGFRKREEGRPARPRGDEPGRPERGFSEERRASAAPSRDRPSRPDRPTRQDRPTAQEANNADGAAPGQRRIRPQQVAAEIATEERIAKVIARAGVASRRDAEAMIAEGRVTLNGAPVTSPALNVGPEDQITVDGEPLPLRERTRLWLFHKPRGLVTTFKDPEGRPTVFEALPEDLPRVVAVGRLDINTEGLLLLTNDGGLARVIAHPSTGWLRRYRVRAHGESVAQADLDKLRGGVTIDGMEYGPVEANLDRVQGDNVWITLGLREGKNREVKRILEHLGLQVNRLIRLSFGPFQLGDLESGLVEEVKTRVLKDQLGATLAAEAGVDFDSPVREPIAPFGTPAQPSGGRSGPHTPRPRNAATPERGFGRARDDRDERRPARGPRGQESGEERGGRGKPSPDRFAPPRRTVWRAGEDEEARASRAPSKRREDPKSERQAGTERQRERVGAVQAGRGRKVLVERLVAERQHEEAPRRGRPPRSQGHEGEARHSRPRDTGGESRGRPAREGDERRAPRSRDSFSPRGERATAPERSGPRPERGGFAERGAKAGPGTRPNGTKFGRPGGSKPGRPPGRPTGAGPRGPGPRGAGPGRGR